MKSSPLTFDRAAVQGMRLNIASGLAVRFESGQQRTVTNLKTLAGVGEVVAFIQSNGMLQSVL